MPVKGKTKRGKAKKDTVQETARKILQSAYPTKAQIRAALKAKGKALPRETRQRVLDVAREGRTLREISEALGLPVPEVYGVILLNTRRVTVLNEVTV